MQSMVEPAMRLMKDRHHGVLVSAMQLLYNICEANPEYLPTLRTHVNDLVISPSTNLL